MCSRDIECSTGASIPSYSGYFGTGKQAEIDRSAQDGVLNELSRNACLRLELGGQYPYQSYNLNLLSEKKFKTDTEMTLQESHVVDYRVNGFELPRPSYDTDHQNWASPSGSCAIAMFDEHSYAQVSLVTLLSLFFLVCLMAPMG